MLSVLLLIVALMTVGLLMVRSSTREVSFAGQLVARERALMAAQAAVEVAAAHFTTRELDDVSTDLAGYGEASCVLACGDCIPGTGDGLITGRRNDVLAAQLLDFAEDDLASTVGCGGRPCMRQGAVVRLPDTLGVVSSWCQVPLRQLVAGADAEAQVTVWVRNNSGDALGPGGSGDWTTESDGRVVVTATATVRNTTVTVEQELQFNATGLVQFAQPLSPDEGYGGGHNNDNTAVAVCAEESLQVDS